MVLSLFAGAACARAEELAFKTYTVADGLAHNTVNYILRDSRGYLWFATSDGLSRFDGREFVSYGRRQGLPHRDVHVIAETPNGELWLGTGAGVCRYRPDAPGGRRFEVHRVEGNERAAYVNDVLADHSGRLWCATDDGVYRVDRGVLHHVPLPVAGEGWDYRVFRTLLQDSHGQIWIGGGSGLYRLRSDGGADRYTVAEGLPNNYVTELMEDHAHRIWAGTRNGLCLLKPHPQPGRGAVERVFATKDGLGSAEIQALRQLSNGTLWVGTTQGLSALQPDGRFRTYTTDHGLPGMEIEALAEDAAGNLWVGTDGDGAAKLPRNAFVTYSGADGLGGGTVVELLEDGQGILWALTRNGSTELYLNRFDGRRFRAVRLSLPQTARLVTWGARSQSVAHGRNGTWWIAAGEYLVRAGADPARGQETAVYTARDGLPDGSVFSVFEDTRGAIWVSISGGRNGVARWTAANRRFQRYSEADGLPPLDFSGISLFTEDRAGDLWAGLFRYGTGQSPLARLRGGRFEPFGATPGAPGGGIRALHLDRRGRLWAGTSENGLLRCDEPAAARPQFTTYTTANALSSDLVMDLAEDRRGRIYVVTDYGVDRLDPQTGALQRYTTSDGLPAGEIGAAFCDSRGTLWLGVRNRLTSLAEEGEHPATVPAIFVVGLRLAGRPYPLPELGVTEVPLLRLEPGRGQLEVDFVAPDFEPGRNLVYRYRLAGTSASWSTPSERRTVNYAGLGAGQYRFEVEALSADGSVRSAPAVVPFVVLAPVWQRGWFLALAISGALALGYIVHRYRIGRALELERVRLRIASDLHDDIGASLSQIAILSEVALASEGARPQQLARIADISRDLVASMSDIVWAINPRRDHLHDLAERMRRYASDVCSARQIELRFHTEGEDRQLGADMRREVLLILKESINNVARHSGAREAEVELRIDGRRLTLRVCDNGRGFGSASGDQGHGLRNMRERARALGGLLDLEQGPGGTTVKLDVPLERRRRPSPPNGSAATTLG